MCKLLNIPRANYYYDLNKVTKPKRYDFEDEIIRVFEAYEADKNHILSVTSINVDHHQTKLYLDAFPNVDKHYCVNRKEFSDMVEPYIGQPNTSFYLVGRKISYTA